YRKATAKSDLPQGLTGNEDLLKQLNEGKGQPLYDKSDPRAPREEQASAHPLMDHIVHTQNEDQHKIAQKAEKDPQVRKVSETHDANGLETVTVERRDGTVVTYNADGTKVTVLPDKVKVTEYPEGSRTDNMKGMGEYPDGTKEYVYKDGSRYFVKGD